MKVFALAASLLVLSAMPATSAEPASADDTARFLAGMQPKTDSPLAPLTRDRSWLRHSGYFDAAFGSFDRQHLAKIRAWSAARLTSHRPVLFYMFSGPDYLHASAFFPNASTYVLSGLEPVGQVPDLTSLPRATVMHGLSYTEIALSSVLRFSFFITRDMRMQFQSGRISGTLPLLYVFLARTGKTVHEVSLINLDEQGNERPDTDRGARSAAHGVKIVFSDGDKSPQTLYYFRTDVSNQGVKNSGFLQFCDKLGTGDGFLKSASYLPHSSNFSKVRDFLLDHSDLILQDDTGIPVSYFQREKWQIRPFGQYVGPINIFARNYQARMRELYRKGHASPIDFGIGYQWRAPNLLLAEKSGKPADAQ